MKKLITDLQHFRFGNQVINDKILVEWFFYDHYDENEENDPRLFNEDELGRFCDYTVRNEINFKGDKNCLNATVEEIPGSSIYHLEFDEKIRFPENLILVSDPGTLSHYIAKTMFISLLDNSGKDRHNYDLDFGVIGRILKKECPIYL